MSHTAELRRHPAGESFIDAAEDAVTRAGCVVVDMQYLTADPQPPAHVCRDLVIEADVYVAVLGFRYGSPVRDHEELSYTELEFQTAEATGKPMLVFLLDENIEGHRDLLVDWRYGDRQEAFRRRIGDAGITRAKARSPGDLKTAILQALQPLATAEQDRVAPAAGALVWKVPTRNTVFTGREAALTQLHDSLRRGETTVVQALHGMGGIGKSALVVEYAHRHAAEHDITWWVPSQDPATVPAGLAELARALKLADNTDPNDTAVTRLRAELLRRDRWLLIYDNAEDPQALADHLCTGPGQILITSRNPDWHGVASPIELPYLDDHEAVALLRRRATRLGNVEAAQIADALENLPLALTQAGAFIAATGTSGAEYVRLLEQRAGELLTRGGHVDYPVSFAASWQLSLDQLAQQSPAALQLLTMCAYLAPEPIPINLFTSHPEHLPEPLAEAGRDPLAFTDLTALLRRRALAKVDTETLQLHRLVQALLRDRHDQSHPETP